jgi:hypothetical protein
MEQSQLVELIRTLGPREKEQVIQFASLSFFNQSKLKSYVIPLLNICLNHEWSAPEKTLGKRELFEMMFPDQPFIVGKLEKIMVEAHKVIQAFLLTQNYFQSANEFHRTLDFSEVVRKKGLEARYQQYIAKLHRLQAETTWKTPTYFHHQFLLEEAIHKNETLHNQGKGDLNVPSVLYSLELYYYLNRLIFLNQFLLQQKITNIEVPEIIKPMIESNSMPGAYLADSPAIKINFEIFNLLKKKSPEPVEVKALFHLILMHEEYLDSESQHEFFAYLRNLCTLIISQDAENLEIEYLLHELYIDNLKKGYLHYEGKISRTRYWMISNNALRVKNYDWALEFIEKYKFEIRDENKDRDVYRLNLANYLFGVKRFSECLDNISATTPFTDYLLLGKRLELKSLYELRSDLLSYKLDAFKMFLSRTSQKLLSESQRQMNQDFANLLHQLSNSKPNDPKRSETILKRLQEKKQAAEWRWLLEKAKELKNT